MATNTSGSATRARLAAGVAVLFLLFASAGGCRPDKAPEVPPGPPLPITAGNYDCAAPATWKTTTFAALVPTVQRALAGEDAQAALGALLSAHYDEEVTCVAAYIHDESTTQAATATDPELARRRVDATGTWIARQAARQVVVTNYGGEAR